MDYHDIAHVTDEPEESWDLLTGKERNMIEVGR